MLLTIALATVAVLAAPLQPRAGGPAIVPIPSNCSVNNPLPPATCEVSSYKVADNIANASLVYQAYYDSILSQDDTWTQCIEQCYGFATRGTCKAALLAYDVPYPTGWLGQAAGAIAPTACLMYGTALTPADFTAAAEGQYQDERAGNILC